MVAAAQISRQLTYQNVPQQTTNPSINVMKTPAFAAGVQVKVDASKPTETIHLIDWQNTEANHFALAEEVTLRGNLERRPDLVFYVNGIAIGVLELSAARWQSPKASVRASLTNSPL